MVTGPFTEQISITEGADEGTPDQSESVQALAWSRHGKTMVTGPFTEQISITEGADEGTPDQSEPVQALAWLPGATTHVYFRTTEAVGTRPTGAT